MELLAVLEAEQLRHDFAGLRSVTVEVGQLSGVDPAALRSAWATAAASSRFGGDVRLELVDVAPEGRCNACDDDVPLKSPQDHRCRRCGTPCIDLVRGTELDIVRLEMID